MVIQKIPLRCTNPSCEPMYTYGNTIRLRRQLGQIYENFLKDNLTLLPITTNRITAFIFSEHHKKAVMGLVAIGNKDNVSFRQFPKCPNM